MDHKLTATSAFFDLNPLGSGLRLPLPGNQNHPDRAPAGSTTHTQHTCFTPRFLGRGRKSQGLRMDTTSTLRHDLSYHCGRHRPPSLVFCIFYIYIVFILCSWFGLRTSDPDFTSIEAHQPSGFSASTTISTHTTDGRGRHNDRERGVWRLIGHGPRHHPEYFWSTHWMTPRQFSS